MRKLAYFLVGIVVLAGLAVGGYFGTLFYVGGKLRTALDQSLAKLPPGWKGNYKDASLTSLFPRTLTVQGMELHHTTDTLVDATIEEITILNPPMDPEDPANAGRLADSLTFKNTSIRAQGDEMKIASIKVAAPRRYPASAVTPSPIPDLPPELAQALADLDRTGFDSATIDDIAIIGGNNGPAGGIKQITVGALDHGLLNGAIALSGFSVQGPAADKSVIALDRFEIAQPNFRIVSDWQKVAADPSKLTADTVLPVVQAVTLKGLNVDIQEPGVGGAPATDDKIKLASAQLTNLRLFPSAWLKNGQAAMAQAMNAIQHPPEGFDPDALLPVLRSEAALLVSFAYGSTIDGIDASVVVPGEDSVPTRVSYQLRHAETVNYDRGKLDHTSLEGFVTKIEPGIDTSIDKVELAGLDVRDVCEKLAANAPIDPALVDSISLARFAYSGLSVKTDELTTPVTLGSIVLSNIGFAHGLLSSFDFAINDAKIAKAQVTDPDATEFFTKMGLDTLTMSFASSFKWDAAKHADAVQNVSLKVAELGAADLSLDFTGIDAIATLEQNAKFKGADLHYKDASLAGRLMKAAAEESGADPAAFRKQIATLFQAQAKTTFGTSPAVTAAVSAVQAFLADPHDLAVQLAPPTPIGYDLAQSLENLPPAKIFAALGVKVTANQATK